MTDQLVCCKKISKTRSCQCIIEKCAKCLEKVENQPPISLHKYKRNV